MGVYEDLIALVERSRNSEPPRPTHYIVPGGPVGIEMIMIITGCSRAVARAWMRQQG